MYFSVLKLFLLTSLLFFITHSNAQELPQTVPTKHSEWLYQDLQRFLPTHEIATLTAANEEFIILSKEETTGIPRGVAFIVPDINQGVLKQAALSNLYSNLNNYGWSTVLMTNTHSEDITQSVLLNAPEETTAPSEPAESQPDNIAADNPNQFYEAPNSQTLELQSETAIQAQTQLTQRMTASVEYASKYPGFYLIICEGKSCAWIIKQVADEQIIRPDALVMLSAYFPESIQNRSFATQLAVTDYPVLDLYQSRDNRWVEQAIVWRKKMARKHFKTDYRQRQLNSYYDYYGQERRAIKEITGFLHAVGM